MSEYKRLTYYLDEQCTMLVMPQRKERIKKYIERLAELEDKIESGELKFDTRPKPKYKLGDTLYYIKRVPTPYGYYKLTIENDKVKRIYRGKKIITYYISRYYIPKHEENLFTTKEAAEARLKELQEVKK